MSKYISTLLKCKGISKLGAQQLLLDTQSLKTALLDLPSITLTVKRKPPDKWVEVKNCFLMKISKLKYFCNFDL